MLIKKAVLLVLMLSMVLVAQGTALASSIFIENPSFEADVPPTGGSTPWGDAPGNQQWNNSVNGWITAGQGTQVPYMGGSAFDSVPQGSNVAWDNGDTIFQGLGATLQPGAYTLSVWVGAPKYISEFPGYTVALYAGGTPVASGNSRNPGPGQWLQDILTCNIASGNTLIGQPLEIRLESNGIQVCFDDVTLNYVPIPGSVLLLGSGLVGMIFWRRKRAVL